MSCRHLTKAGTPCKAFLSNPNWIACRMHSTAEDLELNTLISKVWSEAWSQGYSTGEAAGRQHAENEAARTERHSDNVAHFRTHDDRGQLVVVDGRYTYRWCGASDLAVGDIVTLPPSWVSQRPRPGRVTALGSSYAGSITDIVGKAQAA